MSKRNPFLLVADMIESGQKIMAYTDGLTFDQFVSDSKTIDAVIRNFEIIGEAANPFLKSLRMTIQKLNGIEFVDFGIELSTIIPELTTI
jgi:uncharacterized protein with HEPN domain